MSHGLPFRYDYSHVRRPDDVNTDIDWAQLAGASGRPGAIAGSKRPLRSLARVIVLGAIAVGVYFAVVWVRSNVANSSTPTAAATAEKVTVPARRRSAVRHKAPVAENPVVPLTTPMRDMVIVTADSPDAPLPFTIEVLTSAGRVRLWLRNGGYYVDDSGRMWMVRTEHGSTVLHPAEKP